MSADDSVHAGARQIVEQCLGLRRYQQFVILMDETTSEPAVAIAEAAEELGVSHTVILVPVSVQRRIPSEKELSLPAQGAAREARAILTCVNARQDCLPFRRFILETHWSARTRIGHMPGASLHVLRLADVDFRQLVSDCWSIEIALARGHSLELISYAADGTPHSLAVDIGGWERLPVGSDGVIGDGAWGNVPSGETYIAPLEGRGNGTVVINGSVPGLVVGDGDEITLFFERGRLRRIEPEDNPTARWLSETQILKAQGHGDLNWSNLAEIGIGLNPAVERLTGNMLFDEKAAGTAHVALGSNSFMGGIVESMIHCDMVTVRPTVIVDGRAIMERGRLCYRESDWHDDQATVSLAGSSFRTCGHVARSGIQATSSGDGRLQRVLRPAPGRVSSCFVGDNGTARLASALYALIPEDGDWLPVEELATRARMESDLVRRVLQILSNYELVRVR